MIRLRWLSNSNFILILVKSVFWGFFRAKQILLFFLKFRLSVLFYSFSLFPTLSGWWVACLIGLASSESYLDCWDIFAWAQCLRLQQPCISMGIQAWKRKTTKALDLFLNRIKYAIIRIRQYNSFCYFLIEKIDCALAKTVRFDVRKFVDHNLSLI